MRRLETCFAWISCATMIFCLGCGGGGSAPAVQKGPSQPTAIAVSASASSMALGSGKVSTLTAIVSNDSSGKGVTWSMPAGSPGTLTTVDSLHATYTAGTVTQPGTVVITATSVADATKTTTVTLALENTLAVVVTPASADLGGGQTVALTASVANDPKSAGVTWTLSAGALGALSQQTATSATYTAPATVTSAGTDTVTATSVTDTTVSTAAAINLHPASVTMAAPATSSVGPLETSRLTATANYVGGGVTWTASTGTITGLDSGCTGNGGACCPQGTCNAIYLAPPDIAANATATITVTSVADPTKSATQTIALAAPAAPAWEGLVAFDNGRDLHAIKPYADLERGGKGSGTYQPDRMIFHEVTAGPNSSGQPLDTEIWQLDNDSPPIVTPGDWPNWVIPGTLNRTPWNANGSYFDLSGTVCSLEVYCHTTGSGGASTYVGDPHNYLFSGDGSAVQSILPTAPDGAAEEVMVEGAYLPWDKINANLFYVVTDGSNDSTDLPGSALYSVDISNHFQMKDVKDLPYTPATDPVTGYPLRRSIQSYLSENDVVMVTDNNPPDAASGQAPDYVPNIYMVDVKPGSPTQNTIEDQFADDFSANGVTMTPPPASCYTVLPGENGTVCAVGSIPFSTSDEYHFHDIYFQRDAGDHFIFNYGPKGDVGEGIFWQASLNGKTVNLAYPNPLGAPYMGHPAFNFDGTEVAFGGYDTVADSLQGTSQGVGNWIRSVGTDGNLDDGGVAGNVGKLGVGHQGWDGYDPKYVVFDGYSTASAGGDVCGAQGDAMWSEMSGDPTSMAGTFRVLVNDGLRNNEAVAGDCASAGGNEPSIINGPSQSPDATKMMFSMPENFTGVNANGTTVAAPFDVYLAVDHRPFPPSITAAAGGGSVTLTITPNADHPHKEIAGYHVYTSTDGKSFTEIQSASSNTAAYGSLPVNPLSPVTMSIQVPAGTAYYAATAQEYSGLESSMLSNVIEVSGGAVSQFAAAGTTDWDTTPPAAPTNFAVCQMTAPQGSTGTEWKLTWTKNPATTNLRYYNIYYSGGGVPTITSWQGAQHYLIDSPAASETSYIYWQANPQDVPAFGIVAVDRQDQASTPLFVQTALQPQACTP